MTDRYQKSRIVVLAIALLLFAAFAVRAYRYSNMKETTLATVIKCTEMETHSRNPFKNKGVTYYADVAYEVNGFPYRDDITIDAADRNSKEIRVYYDPNRHAHVTYNSKKSTNVSILICLVLLIVIVNTGLSFSRNRR